MDWIKKLLSGSADRLVQSIGQVIDETVTTDEEKSQAKERISILVMDNLQKVLEMQSQVILAEAKGNALQRNWRPIVMLMFAFVVVYAKFLAPVFQLEQVPLENQFWELLEIGIGGYVIGRSVEKVAGKVTEKIDLSFLRKKDRS
ncbi:3TM-type holin [Algivirga pacifica]|uniref:Holin of 3TMs, for gene-transfer release n=1 Tax=Algivirga pacifica TaxID=1162670 RepID=A0ABP9DM43_9BACT